MTQGNPTLDYTICLLRVIACLLIIWNHASCDIFGGWGNGWLWANIGVQIFFFMSGYLYGGREIEDVKPWFLKQFKKIAKPYYLYLAVFFPIIYFLDPSVLTFTNILIELVFLEGFAPGYPIGYIGHHWFISYILLCYILTPFLLSKIRISGGYWTKIIIATIILQAVTLPLALLIKLKIAYIMTFAVGYFYKVRYLDNNRLEEKRILHISIVVIALILIAVRAWLESENFIGLMDKMKDMSVQYIKLVWAFAIFIIFEHLIPSDSWKHVNERMKNRLSILSGMTYEIYIVHQFYVTDTFTQFFPFPPVIKFVIALIFMFATGWLLWRVSKMIKI